jgi:Tol biopolymer transport system component
MRLVFFAFLALTAAGHLAAAPNDRFEGKDLFDLQSVTDPQIRPDGREVAYVRVTFDIATDQPRRSIWLVETDKKTQIPLDTGPGSANSPRWSPDGTRLAYVLNDGNRSQLFVRWMQSGQITRITDLIDPPTDLQWSPDGQSIAFISLTPGEKVTLGSAPPKPEGANWAPPLIVITDLPYRADNEGYLKPGYPHIFVVSAEGGYSRQLTFGAFNDTGPLAWTPDGKFVLFSANRFKEWRRDSIITHIYQVSVADMTVTQLNHLAGSAGTPRVSPDGKKIAYLGYEDRSLRFRDVRMTGETTTRLLIHSTGPSKTRSGSPIAAVFLFHTRMRQSRRSLT